MEFDAVLLAPRRAAMSAQGLWLDRTINDALDACVAACPDKVGLTAVHCESGAVTRLTQPDKARLAERAALELLAGPASMASKHNLQKTGADTSIWSGDKRRASRQRSKLTSCRTIEAWPSPRVAKACLMVAKAKCDVRHQSSLGEKRCPKRLHKTRE